jgi:hypothetical protein
MDCDGDAVEALEALSPILRGTSTESLLPALSKHVEQYEFEQALPILDQVENVLDQVVT